MHPQHAERAVRRVRHEVKRRHLAVTQTTFITPKMRRITFAGPELEGFTSLGFDDHIKLIFPQESAAAERPPMRDYTPRYDGEARALHVDFAIHDAGLATSWAVNARVGDTLLVGGPRGSAIIPQDFDWHLFIGDETALPAIGRRLEELPAGSRALAIVEVQDEEERQTFATRAELRVQWVLRGAASAGTADALVAAVRSIIMPSGDYFSWAAAETNVARAIRRTLIDERGANRSWVKAAGYWRLGAAAVHDTIED
jgi:NADPH-dependent ferric siderophore reductase